LALSPEALEGLVSVALLGSDLTLPGDFAAATIALLGVRTVLPDASGVATPPRLPRWDLPVRMLAAAMLVVLLTSAADRLGPQLSGVLTPFPVAVAIMAAFTHGQEGPRAVSRFLRAFLPGLCTFALFCLVLAGALTRVSVAAAFGVALAVQMISQGVLLATRD